MRSKATKKMAKKEVKARKRDDEETKEEMKRIEAVGKAVKKATRKDKGKLGELVESIKKFKSNKREIYCCECRVLRFPNTTLYCDTLQQGKIIDQLRYITKTKEVGQEFIGSGEVAALKPGMKIKEYFLSTRDSFQKKNSNHQPI